MPSGESPISLVAVFASISLSVRERNTMRRIQNDERESHTGGDAESGPVMAPGTHPIASLFGLSSHSPSFVTVRNSHTYRDALLDFCVPVNLHFQPPALMEMIASSLEEILYYCPDCADVHQLHIAALTELAADTIVPANGATEVISILCQEAAGPMLISVPTFGRWTDIARELNVPLRTIERKRESAFRLEVDRIVQRVREVGARTLVISNPDNPTGASLSLAEVKTLATELDDLHSVVVDESFIDFADLESAAALVTGMRNLVVVKSMDKSLGWHGVRVGYGVAQPQRAASLRRRLPWWNITGVAAFVLKHLPRFKQEYQRERRQRGARPRLHGKDPGHRSGTDGLPVAGQLHLR